MKYSASGLVGLHAGRRREQDHNLNDCGAAAIKCTLYYVPDVRAIALLNLFHPFQPMEIKQNQS